MKQEQVKHEKSRKESLLYESELQTDSHLLTFIIDFYNYNQQ